MNVTSVEIHDTAYSAQGRSRPGASSRRWPRVRSAVRAWVDRGHLGPVHNYVNR